MKLYYAPGTVSVAIAIALHEAGLDFESRKVNFKEAEQTKPEYHAINPKGRVPALEIEGAVLTETGAILDYIAAIRPEAALMPEDPIAAARVRGVMYYLASTMQPNHAHGPRGYRWAENEASFEDMRAQVPKTMRASAAYVEDHCLASPFVMGGEVTIADPHLFIMCQWLKGDGVDPDDFPRLSAFMAAMEERTSVKAVRAAGML